MGNELFSQYTIEKTPFLSGGYLNLWKIYKGTHKDRKQDVCVFVFEKKILDKYQRDEREEILNILRKEASSLIKYKHPSILGIVEPLIEDKTSIGFVTEEICFTLTSWVESVNPSKLEIKQMIIELNKVVSFLHEDAHVIHANINPDVIFIDKLSKVKISGMNFAINDPPVAGGELVLSMQTIPNLKYTAPEIVYQSKAYYSSDVFSVALIVYTLLKFNKGATDRELLNLSMNTIDSYKSNYPTIDNKLSRANFDQEDISLLAKGLIKDHSVRVGIKELADQPWFNDPKLKAFSFIQNLQGNDPNKNIEFLQQFPKIVSMFETKLIINRFLPCLLEGLKNELLINPLLPAIFSIAELPGIKLDFSREIWPKVKELFQLKSINAASLYYMLSKVIFIGDHLSNTEFTNSFLNIICKAMDCNVSKIQSMVATNLSFITKKIDSLSFKNQIYPRVIQILSTTNSTELKLELLNSVKVSLTQLDQTIINESLLNNLEKIRKGDSNAEVLIAICSIYEEIAKFASIESIANKILPALISMLVNGKISKSNFDTIMQLVYKYLDKIKVSREKDLIDDMKNEKKGNSDFMSLDTSGGGLGAGNRGNGDKGDFLSSFFGGESAAGNNSNVNVNRSYSNPTNIQESNPIGFINAIANSGNNQVNTNTMSMNTSTSSTGGFDLNFKDNSNRSNTNMFEGIGGNQSMSSSLNKNFSLSNQTQFMPNQKYSEPNKPMNTSTSTNNNLNPLFSGLSSSTTSAYNTKNFISNTNQSQTKPSNDLLNQLNAMSSSKPLNAPFDLTTNSNINNNPIKPKSNILDSLLNDLPSSQGQGQASNPINMNMNTTVNVNQGNSGNAFNQNNLDFLAQPSKKPGFNANDYTFDLGLPSSSNKTQFNNNSLNTNMNINSMIGNKTVPFNFDVNQGMTFNSNNKGNNNNNNDPFAQFNMQSQPQNKPSQASNINSFLNF